MQQINNMKLNDILNGQFDATEWEAKGYQLPKFDIKALREKTAKEPTWVVVTSSVPSPQPSSTTP